MFLILNFSRKYYLSFRSVVVITCASHAQGHRFDPGRKHKILPFFGYMICHKKGSLNIYQNLAKVGNTAFVSNIPIIFRKHLFFSTTSCGGNSIIDPKARM